MSDVQHHSQSTRVRVVQETLDHIALQTVQALHPQWLEKIYIDGKHVVYRLHEKWDKFWSAFQREYRRFIRGAPLPGDKVN